MMLGRGLERELLDSPTERSAKVTKCVTPELQSADCAGATLRNAIGPRMQSPKARAQQSDGNQPLRSARAQARAR
eukprot:203820-Alexandrium_andersonii.AAC.1